MTGSIEVVWINAVLAGSGVLAALGSINRMGKDTNCAIRFACVTLAAGLFGQAASTCFPQHWQAAIDTMLFGGVLALLIGCRKMPLFVSEAFARWSSVLVTLATWIAFMYVVQL